MCLPWELNFICSLGHFLNAAMAESGLIWSQESGSPFPSLTRVEGPKHVTSTTFPVIHEQGDESEVEQWGLNAMLAAQVGPQPEDPFL